MAQHPSNARVQEDSQGIWMNATYGGDLAGTKDMPGNSTELCCHIIVPFAHYLRSATYCFHNCDKSGTVTVKLMQADSTDAEAGTLVGTSTTPAATNDLFLVQPITLADADKAEVTTALRVYFLHVQGTNAGDRVDRPTLTICVEPVRRSQL